jgi:hypothetical protein
MFLVGLAFSAEPVGKIVEVRGEAVSTSSPKGVAAGSPVFEGDLISTKEGSLVRVLLDDSSALQLGPNTQTRIERPGGSRTRVELLAGSLASMVRALVKGATNSPRFEVKAGQAVMGVRGTLFFVQQIKAKPTFLCVCNGTVGVKWKGRDTTITSKHHDAPKYLDPKKKDMIPAPMGSDHSDADGEALQKVLDLR